MRQHSLLRRLTAGMRRNVRSVGLIHPRPNEDGSFKGSIGTGFVVQRSRGRALVLTNYHVWEAAQQSGEPIEMSFGPSFLTTARGRTLQVRGAVAMSKRLDYALIVPADRGARDRILSASV